jgi:hypothetical protein|tara:strand:+ start:465 stop:1328 length:864 start_codon:yes stop_codon:yes gene_type:complete
MGKGNKQAQSSKQTIVNELPEYARPHIENVLDRVEAESNQGFQQYGGQRLADSGSIADIADSRNMVRNVARAGLPELQEAIGGMRDISQRGQFTGQMAQDYMNPYMEAVVNRQKDAAIRDFNRMGAARAADAVNAGAFGGSRAAVANYLAEEGLQNQLGDIDAAGREAAFRDARAGFDADRQLGMQGLSQLASMGGARRAGDIQGAQLLEGIGKQQLAEQQAGLDIGYQDFLNQQNFNKDQLGFYSNIIQGIPIQPNKSVANYQTYNPMQQALGAGIAGLGLYRGMA